MIEQIAPERAAALVPDGASVMIGGFMGCGTPHALVDALCKRDARCLTVIADDAAMPDYGIGRLVREKRIKKLIASHVGLNPEAGRQMTEGSLAVELVPQGTLAERIRSAGAGLGGILTPTGVGTPVEEGKRKLAVNGREYLLELPLRADVALVKAWRADERGNLVYRLSARNFNPLMVMAADLVLAEIEEIVPVGALHPDQIHTPFVFVDRLVRV
jgi:acetate CoA/acetoacetate CoA-transferase alpha subunit